MSGSFWKFGQGYSTESPLTQILNRAFIKITDNEEENRDSTATPKEITTSNSDVDSQEDDMHDFDSDGNQENASEDAVVLPDTEAEYKNYIPNLDVLEDLLDEEELYTELMCSNFKLLIYLKYPQVLSKLIDYIMVDNIIAKEELRIERENNATNNDNDPLNNHNSNIARKSQDEDTNMIDSDDRDLHRKLISNGLTHGEGEQSEVDDEDEDDDDIESSRAHMASEVLSADVWPISATIMENDELLHKIWSITNIIGALPIEASTYFMKINERLLDMNMTSMIDFIMSQDDIVDRFLRHIDDPPLIDFFLKVISTDKPDINNGIIDMLKRQKLIPKLIERLSSQYDQSIQAAATDFLKALLAISGNCTDEIASSIGPNELTRELVSPSVMENLINIMLTGGTSLSNGVGIIIELIRKNNSDYDYVQIMLTTLETHPPNDRDPICLGHMLKLFAQYMPQFNKILVESTTPILDTSFGRIEPLGFERFKICELVAELLHCSNMGLLNEKKGEEIIKERDAARNKLLYDMEPEDTEMVEYENEEESNEPKNEDVTKKLNTLNIENESSLQRTQAHLIDENDPNVTIPEEESDDYITDSDEELAKIRRDPVIGDLLKISLFDTQIITTILEMFFHFSWNNFLHNVVFDITQQIFNGPLKTTFNKFLLKDLILKAEITKLIMDADIDNDSYNNNKKSEEDAQSDLPRLGYMGHLTLIAEEIVKFDAYLDEMNIVFATPSIDECLNSPEWRNYVNTTLTDRRERYDLVLGDLPPHIDNDEDDDEEVTHGMEDEDEDEETKYTDHVYGTEHIIFTNEISDEDDDEDTLGNNEEQNNNKNDNDYEDDDEDFGHKYSASEKETGSYGHGVIVATLDGTEDDLIDEDEDYAEYSDRDNEKYSLKSVSDNNSGSGSDSSHGSKIMLFSGSVEFDEEDEDNCENGDERDNRFSEYMSNELGRSFKTTRTTTEISIVHSSNGRGEDNEEDNEEDEEDLLSSSSSSSSSISSSSSSDEDIDLDIVEELEDEEVKATRDSQEGDKSSKRGRNKQKNSHEDKKYNSSRSSSGSGRSSTFVLNDFQTRSLPASPEVHDEDIFQHQFELDEEDNGDDDHDDDDTEYLDPNDDGQSYAQVNRSLYGGETLTGDSFYSKNVYYSSQVLSSGDCVGAIDSDEDMGDSDRSDDEDEEEEGHGQDTVPLYRSKSKHHSDGPWS